MSTIDLKFEFEFYRAKPKDRPPCWVFRCACGAPDCDLGDLYGPFRTKREAVRAAGAFAEACAKTIGACAIEGGDAIH